jgi:hypothetical protein
MAVIPASFSSPQNQPSGPGLPASAATSPNRSTDESTILISLNKEQEDNVIKAARNWQNSLYTLYNLRSELENIDREYMRERDWTPEDIKARIANRRGDSRKIRNITVPIVQPQVSSALTYLCEVYCSGYPMFPVVADPEHESQALQLETIVNENATTAGYAQQLAMFFRDGLKYNLCAIECDWKQRTNWTIVNDASKANSAGPRKRLWEGNELKRLDLYNSFWDPRIHPSEMHKHGEFAGYTEIYSRMRFLKYCNDLYNAVPKANVDRALQSQPIQGAIGASVTSPFGFYIPYVNPFPFFNKTASLDWLNWATNVPGNVSGAEFKNAYSVTTLYARVVPNDFNISRVPDPGSPQVWKFVIINGAVVLSAERMTNIHNFLPIFMGQPIEDGLDYQTKSFAQNVTDLQDIASALWNGALASKRRLVGDRVLYDPTRIRESDINSTNPAAKIPVRPSAYGKPIAEAVYQFPFRDEQTDSLIQGSQLVVNFANLVNGQNPAQQGQFVKGNKTRHEYDDVMGHGNGQNRQLALSFESQIFTPMKEVIKLNIMQYQKAGPIYNTGKGKTVNVDPTDLRTSAVNFKVADGFIPTDQITGDDLMQTALQQLGSSQQIAADYNVGDAFNYLMQTQGLDLTPFKKSEAQVQYEQALSTWQQAAATAAKAGAQFSTPMPQPSQQLQQEQQQKQQTGGSTPSLTTPALESTQN